MLRSHRQGGQTLFEIETWLTAADLQRFALIRQDLQRDQQCFNLSKGKELNEV